MALTGSFKEFIALLSRGPADIHSRKEINRNNKRSAIISNNYKGNPGKLLLAVWESMAKREPEKSGNQSLFDMPDELYKLLNSSVKKDVVGDAEPETKEIKW